VPPVLGFFALPSAACTSRIHTSRAEPDIFSQSAAVRPVADLGGSAVGVLCANAAPEIAREATAIVQSRLIMVPSWLKQREVPITLGQYI
jgi:hypothetical protein